MKIIIKTLQKDEFNVEVPSDANVKDLKVEIGKLRDAQYYQINTIFSGKQMENDKKLSFYNVVDGSTVIIIVNKRKQNPEAPLQKQTQTQTHTQISVPQNSSSTVPSANPVVSPPHIFFFLSSFTAIFI